LDAFESSYTTAGAEALDSSGSQADNLAKIENSGWPGLAEWFGTAWSTVSAVVGDPVHSVTGSFYIDAVDLPLPGPMPLGDPHSYASQNTAENEFGYGWKLAYFPFLSVATGDALISAAEMDGSVVPPTRRRNRRPLDPAAQGQPDPIPQHDRRCARDRWATCSTPKSSNQREGSDTIYTLTGPDGSTAPFQGANLCERRTQPHRPYLERWTDHRGNFFLCSYGTDATKGDFGQLTRIAASNGNFVGFTFRSTGESRTPSPGTGGACATGMTGSGIW